MQQIATSDSGAMTISRRRVMTGAAALGVSTLMGFKSVVASFDEATMAL